MELEHVCVNTGPANTKRTVLTLQEAAGLDVLNNAESSVLAVHDQDGENI